MSANLAEHYVPAEVEPAVQAAWAAADIYRVEADPAREKFYCLAMFPYPSGRLHMGHVLDIPSSALLCYRLTKR